MRDDLHYVLAEYVGTRNADSILIYFGITQISENIDRCYVIEGFTRVSTLWLTGCGRMLIITRATDLRERAILTFGTAATRMQ